MTPAARPPVLLLWGEDAFLLREAALEALGGVHPVEVDAAEWRGGELADLATPSLFGEERALLVSECRSLPDAAVRELAGYLAAPDPNASLVLAVRGRVPAALTKLVKGVGEIREVAVARRDLPTWLVGRARAREMALQPDAARALVDILGDDPAQLDAAVQQLQAAYSGERIGPAHVVRQFQGLGEQRVWDLCDRMFGRDLPGSVRSLASLLESRDEPLAILGGIASRLRDLLRVRSLPDRMPAAAVKEAVGLRFDWQVRKYRDQAGRFTLRELLDVHDLVARADRDMKSGASGEIVLPVLVASVASDGD